MTVGELLGRASSRELAEWQAYHRLKEEYRERREMERRAESGAAERARNPKRGRA